jgi:putative transcription factor
MAERTKSQCEMCGKNVSTRTYTVQGARMTLCMDCSRFGDEYNDPRASAGHSSQGASDSVIQQRLERREKRRQTRDIYAGSETTALREDYGKVIRQAREKKWPNLKDFAESIGEKQLTLSKIEAQTLTPDDKIVAKLEKALGITLRETVTAGATQTGGSQSGGMTLGNFIRVEEKKK